ncbi:hypothetical protein HDZ31DRAFT_82710 [Schizophyllum fasciatum]
MKLDKRTLNALRKSLEQHQDVTASPIRHDPWNTHVSPALGLQALSLLGALLSWLEIAVTPQHVMDSVTGSMRDSWFTLISWLDHVLQHTPNIGADDPIVEVCARFLSNLFRLKKYFSDLLKQTTQPHTWTMKLWLNHWRGIEDGSARISLVGYTDVMLSLTEAVAAMATPVKPADADEYDCDAVWEALAVVGYKAQRVHRYIVRGILRFIGVAWGSTNVSRVCWGSAWDAIRGQLQEVDRLFTALEVSTVRARDVKDLVDLVRQLQDIPGGDDVACTALSLLASYWDCDNRCIIWALKAGVFPLMAQLWTPEMPSEHRETMISLFLTLASWTVYFPIAVAFHRHREGASIKLPGPLGERIHDDLIMRCDLVQDFLRPRCNNYRCPKLVPPADMRAMACKCYEVYYCSQECQRQHWLRHRYFCPFILEKPDGHFGKIGPVIRRDGSYLKPGKDSYFVAQLVQDSLRKQGEDILSSIHRKLKDFPDGEDIRDVAVFFHFEEQVHPAFTTEVYGIDDDVEEDAFLPSSVEELLIYVYARLPPTRRGGDEAPFVEVIVFSLWELQDRVAHFLSCKNHAACISRSQGRPPRCGRLDELGRQCYDCVMGSGVDKDPWTAPTLHECKWGTY